MTINVFSLKNYQIKCILNPSIEKFVKCLCLNVGRSHELAVYFDGEILIYNILEEKVIEKIKASEPKYIEFNSESKLLILSKDNQIYIYDLKKRHGENIKTNGEKVSMARWYPFNSYELAYSTFKGVSYHSILKKNRLSGIDLDIKQENQITDLSWYTLDENYKYVLAGLNDGISYLLDLQQSIVIMQFDKFSEISSLVWLKHEPGSFLSFSTKSSRVAIYNVSKKSHNEITKFSDSGVLYSIPLSDPTKILFSQENGAIVIYDVKARKKIFAIEPNHSETIFDLKYNPTKYNILASCSYESSIKVWDMNENKVIWDLNVDFFVSRMERKVEDGEGCHVYALKWSPLDKDLIASGDSKGYLRIWDINKKKLISSQRINSHPDSQVIGIDWDVKNNLVASSTDIIHLLNFENGKLVISKSFKTASTLFQVKFDPFYAGNFAVACLDNTIRIFSENNDKPINTLTGHSRKVFGICFNPKIRGVFASSSDDTNIGIWNLDKKTNFFLKGHTKNTRHMIWLSEYNNILLSSSWDGTVKIWNIDLCSCIGEISEHYSDVYGIDISPHHPFLLTTCSRDNSIRFFNILNTVHKLTDIILCFDDLEELNRILNQEKGICLHKNLQERLRNVKNNDCVTSADLISNYFYCYEGLKDFWDIIKVVTKQKEYSNQDNKIFYVTDLYSAYKSKVQQLEFSYYNKSKFDYSIRKEDLLKEAIDLSAKAGDWGKFCELCIEANEWEKAIMAAPNVSLSYWKELTEKYAEYCNIKNNNQKIFSSLLSNQLQPAMKNFMEAGDYEDSKIIWLTRSQMSNKPDNRSNDLFLFTPEILRSIDSKLDNLSEDEGIFTVTNIMSKQNLIKGNPILSAASFMSIKDFYNTLRVLIRTGLFEIAYMTMKVLNYYLFENDIMTALLMREIRKGSENYKTIFLKVKNIDCKIVLSIFLKNLKKLNFSIFEFLNTSKEEIVNQINSIYDTQCSKFLVNLISSDISSNLNLFISLTQEIANILLNKKEISTNLFETLIRFMFYIKAIDFKNTEHSEKFYLHLLITSAFIESVNNNTINCCYILKEISNIVGNRKLDDTQNILYNFTAAFILDKYNLEENKVDWSKLPSHSPNIFKDYVKIIYNFRKNSTNKYYCDEMGYFFCLAEEIFPDNILKNSISSLNGKIIKGYCITIAKFKNEIKLSANQGMEWFKLIPTCPLLGEFENLNPY